MGIPCHLVTRHSKVTRLSLTWRFVLCIGIPLLFPESGIVVGRDTGLASWLIRDLDWLLLPVDEIVIDLRPFRVCTRGLWIGWRLRVVVSLLTSCVQKRIMLEVFHRLFGRDLVDVRDHMRVVPAVQLLPRLAGVVPLSIHVRWLRRW